MALPFRRPRDAGCQHYGGCGSGTFTTLRGRLVWLGLHRGSCRDGLTIPSGSLTSFAVTSIVSCRGDLPGCCCLSLSSCSNAARNGFRESGRSPLWLLTGGLPGDGMAGDAVRGLRNGLLELRLRVRRRPGLGSVYESGSVWSVKREARHMKDRRWAKSSY